MNLETSKTLGGIGAILLFIGPLIGVVQFFGSLLSLIGFILVLVALKGLADYYNESGIFNNALYGFIASIVGGVAFIGVLIGSALTALAAIGPGISDWANWEEWTALLEAGLVDLNIVFALLGAVIIAFVVLFIFVVFTAFLYRKSLDILASKSEVGMFHTTGLILLIGAILTRIIIGFIIIWIAFLLLAIAFFRMRPIADKSSPSKPLPPTT